MHNIQTLENGLTLIVEEMPHVESVAYDLQIPGGVICDAPGEVGASLIIAELTTRGAGGLSSRELSDAFEENGTRHSETSSFDRYVYRGALFGKNLGRALELLSFMVRSPALPEAEIENISSIMLQEISALADNPSKRAHIEMHSRYYPEPYARSYLGTVEGLRGAGRESLSKQWAAQYLPAGSVLSIAGGIKTAQVAELCSKYFGTWSGKAAALPEFGKLKAPRAHHIEHDSAQLQIILSFPSAKFSDPNYYAAKIAAGILSGGMFGRLFIEVREKRGLCYSVYARHSATNDYGTVQAYAGTTPERAHETLQVMLSEIRGLRGTISPDEMKRAKANLKATLVMGEESSSSRAASNAGDWWLIKRVRPLDEIIAEIDKLTPGDVDEYLDRFPARGITLLTLGSRELSDVYESAK